MHGNYPAYFFQDLKRGANKNYEPVSSEMKKIPSIRFSFDTKIHFSSFDRHISVWFKFELIKNCIAGTS
jgi:hypothetical protein